MFKSPNGTIIEINRRRIHPHAPIEIYGTFLSIYIYVD